MTLQKLRAQAAATVILVVGLLLLGPLLYLHDQWLTEGVEHSAVKSQLSAVRQSLAKGHLWFEERLIGDLDESDAKWRDLFEHAAEVARGYIGSVESTDPIVLSRLIEAQEQEGDEELSLREWGIGVTHRALAEWVAIEIGAMRSIADERLAKADRAGSDDDRDFDALNARIDRYTSLLEGDWAALAAERAAERQRIHDIAIVIWGSCLAGFVLLLAFVQWKRRIAESEQRRLEERFQQAQKLESLGVLAGGIAHDFNNLLMGVLGNASMAQLEDGIPDTVAVQLKEIERSARKSADLTSQLLAYAGKGKYTEESVDLAELVEDLEPLLRVSLGPNVAVDHEFAEQLPAIRGNPTQLQQVLMNLLINASDAMGERGGRIVVRTGASEYTTEELIHHSQGEREPVPGRYVELEVEDQGPGMDSATLSRCFEPFYTTKFTGRGLGLAAVVGIVRTHGGVIRVDSRAGEGTRFSILLPSVGGEARRRAALSESREVETGSGLLLVVDDDEGVRLLVDRMLQRCGYEVITAPSGEEGLRIFREERHRLRAVLVDMEMPGLSGVETGAALRSLDEQIPVVLTSGYSDDILHEEDGFAGFIQKPYRIEELSTRLAAILAAHPIPERGDDAEDPTSGAA